METGLPAWDRLWTLQPAVLVALGLLMLLASRVVRLIETSRQKRTRESSNRVVTMRVAQKETPFRYQARNLVPRPTGDLDVAHLAGHASHKPAEGMYGRG